MYAKRTYFLYKQKLKFEVFLISTNTLDTRRIHFNTVAVGVEFFRAFTHERKHVNGYLSSLYGYRSQHVWVVTLVFRV